MVPNSSNRLVPLVSNTNYNTTVSEQHSGFATSFLRSCPGFISRDKKSLSSGHAILKSSVRKLLSSNQKRASLENLLKDKQQSEKSSSLNHYFLLQTKSFLSLFRADYVKKLGRIRLDYRCISILFLTKCNNSSKLS